MNSPVSPTLPVLKRETTQIATTLLVMVSLFCPQSVDALENVGVVDRAGKYVIRPGYRRIRYLGKGQYLCYTHLGKHEVLTRDGLINDQLQLPEDKDLESFKLKEDAADTSKDPSYGNRLKQFPSLQSEYTFVRWVLPGLYLATFGGRVPSEKDHLVVDESGKVVFAIPKNQFVIMGPSHNIVTQQMGARNSSKLTFYDPSGQIIKEVDGSDIKYKWFYFGMAIIQSSFAPSSERTEGVIAEDGNWIQPPQLTHFELTENDRIIKSAYDETFIRTAWDAESDERKNQFNNFLRKHDLIGMKRSKVVDLLGPGIGAQTKSPAEETGNLTYTVSGFGSKCGNAYNSVVIEFSNNRAVRWKLSNFSGRQDHWVEQNVVFDRALKKYVPK